MANESGDAKLELSLAVKRAQECYPIMTELWRQAAREYRTKFQAYVDAGFNETQALQMICAELAKPNR